MAVGNAKDFEILNLLLANEKVDINETKDQQGSTALHMAIINSNVNVARFLLSKGANPNVADKNGLTPLHWAANFAKDMDVVELLLNHEDVDVHCLDNKRRNALYYAKYNKRELVERIVNRLKEKGAVERGSKLLKRNSDIKKKHMRVFSNRKSRKVENFLCDDTIPIEAKIDKISEEYLVSAIKDSNVESVRLLLKNGDISEWGEMGKEALRLASGFAKTTDVIDAILETGKFDINGGDNGVTPLHFAIIGTNFETNVPHLIRKGADPTMADKNGVTPLHLATFNAKTIETINLILENKQVDINHRDELGGTALHLAIEKKNVEMARYLLEKGADPTIGTHEGNNSFHLAAQYLADTHVLGLILRNEKKIKIDGRNKTGRTALHFAMTASNVTVARFLLSNGANPNVVDEKGVTPLHLAVMFAKEMDIVELLLNHKDTDVNCLDNGERNALDFAQDNMFGHVETIAKLLKEKGVVSQTVNCLNDEKAENDGHIVEMLRSAIVDSDVKFVRLLTQIGSDISTVAWGEGWNALHIASNCVKKTEILDAILETGQFDINGRDVNGATALHFALYAKNVTTALYLMKRGADPTIGDKNEITPFHLAASHATTTDVIKLILKGSQVDINSPDVDGWTPLYYAIEAKNVENARYLLERGADPTIRDYNGYNTPFHLAATNSKESDILDLLLKSENVDINETRCQQGSTALHFAITASNLTAARFLLAKGANPNVVDDNGFTPLREAVFLAKDMDIVELLLNHKDTNVNLLDNSGNNALHYAKHNQHGLGEAIANLLREKMAAKAEGSNNKPKKIAALVPSLIEEDSDIKTIRFLIENGQDVSAMTWGENGANALHLAAKNEETTELIDIILETGQCNINPVDGDGRTPLHYAINRPDPVTINARRLIKMGADPNVADKNGVTPLHMAARNAESMDLIELLLNTEKLNVNDYDHNGLTALAYARFNKHGLSRRIIDRLRESGANEW